MEKAELERLIKKNPEESAKAIIEFTKACNKFSHDVKLAFAEVNLAAIEVNTILENISREDIKE